MNYSKEGSAPMKPLVTFKNAKPTSMKKQVLANDKKNLKEKSNRSVIVI
jgi:hypothetical protein